MLEDWKKCKLGEITNLATGYAFKSKYYEDVGSLKVIRGKNVTEGYLRWGGDSRFWNHSVEKLDKYNLEESDIVIGMDGSKIGKNRAIVRRNDLPSILAQRVARVRAKEEKACQSYIWQLINNNLFENYVENVKTGTSIPHISLSQINDFDVLLPPLKEQRAIGSVLSALDDKIEVNLQINKSLEDMAMALYKHWFVDFAPFENGEFVESELGMIPKGWEVKKLGDIAEVNTKSIKKSDKINDIEYIDIASVNEGWVSGIEPMLFSKAPSRARRIVSDGDIVWSTVRPNRKSRFLALGFSSKTVVSTGFAVITPKLVSYSYLYPYTCTEDFADYLVSRATGSSFPAVTGTVFKEAKILIPQKTILDSFTEIIKPLFVQFSLNNSENQTLTVLKDNLLPKLISGEIRVKDIEQTISKVL